MVPYINAITLAVSHSKNVPLFSIMLSIFCSHIKLMGDGASRVKRRERITSSLIRPFLQLATGQYILFLHKLSYHADKSLVDLSLLSRRLAHIVTKSIGTVEA